ncbi:MAG: DNA gyrase subunit A [Methanoculleaceae archaeon]
MTSEKNVVPVNIEDEMKSSYIDYAMSVIIGRAIPDVRDGLKPVHRRTLYAMWEMGVTSTSPYKKSARIVGDVMGKYHPHGDAAIYDTLVKMAQPFTYRYPLVDGQGNFGSIDGDSAAAMRYTEARLTPIAEEMLRDIEKDTVDFTPNFDGSLKEPAVLPSAVPNLLVNGSSGIAVGMATSMPPHNLREVCRAIIQVIDEPGISTGELMKVLPGPDFPTGGIILGDDGIRQAYETGRGKCIVRGVAEIEEEGRTTRIVIREIPYQVNKARLIEHMASLVNSKKIEGISDIRDESDKEGLRVVVELKRGVTPDVVLNQLYRHTSLETGFGIINLAIVDRQPRYLSLKDLISEFLRHRIAVVRRRSEFDLRRAEERIHILHGLLIALDSIDAVIATIRRSETADDARIALIANFDLDEVQADAILKMQLRRLAALERRKIIDERDALSREIERLREILSSERSILRVIRAELEELSEAFPEPRRTRILRSYEPVEPEQLIEEKAVLITLTASNYIKRIDVDTFRRQHRGGKGIIGMPTKEDDVVASLFYASTLDYLLCFTDRGRVYWLKVYDVPEGRRKGRGRHIANLLPLDGESLTTIIPVSSFEEKRYLFFATRNGTVARIPQTEFAHPRRGGINAVSLREGDELIDVKVTDGSREVILTSRMGQSLRFHEENVRIVHRGAMGVRGIRLREGDNLQSISVISDGRLLTVTEKGYGKRTDIEEFPSHGRGTMGVRNINTLAAGPVVASRMVGDDDEIVLITAAGIVMRTKVSEIPVRKRGTRGVRIIRPDPDDRLVGLAVVDGGEPDRNA